MAVERGSLIFRSTPGLIIGAVALCVVLPFLRLGIPSGHDFEFHMNSWIEVVDQWKQGVLYPHWAAMAHYGYGEARFIFYPPLSWKLGAGLGLVLPWKLVPVAYIWIVLTVAGCSMYLLARRWLPRRDAIFAAALYAANPYHLVIVYWRSAMAELMAAAYLPLLLVWILRSDEDGARIVVPLSLLIAAGWLTNVPAAVMMNYSLAVLILCSAVMRRSFAIGGYGALAASLGAGIAGFYLAVVVHERSWVHIAQVLAPGVNPSENFLFASTNDADHDRFNLLVSIVAAVQIVVAGVTLFLIRRQRSQKLWWMLLAWGAVSSVLMTRYTLPLWVHLPELRFVQLPWRWLLCLNVVFVLALAMALRLWWLRGLACAAMLGLILFAWNHVQTPWWDTAADIKEMVDNQHDGIGNEGTDEYVPVTADPDEADQKAPLVRFEGGGRAQIRVERWRSESRLVNARVSAPGKLVLRLFNYPSWHVSVNGQAVKTETADPSGQMIIPVAAGENRVQIIFVQGGDRILGIAISIFALAILLAWVVASRRFLRSAPA
jgi:hypothetical protein